MYQGLLKHIKDATQDVEKWQLQTDHVDKLIYLIRVTNELVLHLGETNVFRAERNEPLKIDFWMALDMYRCDHEMINFLAAISQYRTLWDSKHCIEYQVDSPCVDIDIQYKNGTQEHFSTSKNYVSDEMIKSMEEYFEKQKELFQTWLPWLKCNVDMITRDTALITEGVNLSDYLKKEAKWNCEWYEDDWTREITDFVCKKVKKIKAEANDYEAYFFEYLIGLKNGDALMHAILKAHHTDSLLDIDDPAIILYLYENEVDDIDIQRLTKIVTELNFLKKMANPEQFVKKEVVKSVPIKSKTGRKKVSVLDCIVSENKEEILAKMKAEMPKLPNGPSQAGYLNKLKMDEVLSNFPSFNALKEEELITVSKTAWNNAIKVYR